jgi:peptide/nickel transport system permease protein
LADVHPEPLTLRITAPVAAAGAEDDAPPLSQRRLFRRYCRHRLAVAGLIVFVALLIFAFAGQPLWHYQYNVFTNALSQPPSLAHPFGTNTAGYDLLSQVLHGTQRSLEISLFVALVAGTFGSIWGAVAGLFGGRTDTLMMRFADLVLIFPILAIAAALANRFAQRANSWFFLAAILAGLTWPYVSRLVRGVVLSLRERDFIVAARAYGASRRYLVFRHLLPNAMGTIIVATTIILATSILAATALSFLGFGVQPPDTDLGSLVSQNQSAIFAQPWLFYFPGLFIVLIALSANFIGDGLRDAFDTTQAGSR